MGYDVHIERDRATHPQVTLDEWLHLVGEDAELKLVGFAEAHSPAGEIIRYENKGLATWSAHPAKQSVWFDYRNGRIVVKNPDRDTLGKMRSIAVRLGARVRGDEGEFYDE
jgi:hypothetical protein